MNKYVDEMLTHLIILLDDTSPSYCHYEVSSKKRRLIRLDDLKSGILFAMKENLNVQFVYPNYALPEEYVETIEMIDHTKIKPESISDDADVISITNWKEEITEVVNMNNHTCIIRANRKEIIDNRERLKNILGKVARLNVVLTDVIDFSDNDIDEYKSLLSNFADDILAILNTGKNVQMNLLTDRIMLDEMNNCNAGVNNVTLAPNGKFYLCPAFYYDNPQDDIGDIKVGLIIKNQQLLRLDHAPICRNCDAFQCKRCIWLNDKLTLDKNTPSHQQCVMAHLERNASSDFVERLNDNGIKLSNTYKIEKVTELDPFNIVNRWK